MTYVLNVREAPSVPAMTITIAQTSLPHASPVTWKAHLQYTDGSRQTSATFATQGGRMLDVFAQAMAALNAEF